MSQAKCEDCGTSIDHRRNTAKYCASCALLRVLLWSGSTWKRAKRCGGCNALYRPLQFKERRLCGRCLHRVTVTQPHPDPCAFCKGEVRSPYNVPACLACLKDPKVRLRVVASLSKGQDRRRAA